MKKLNFLIVNFLTVLTLLLCSNSVLSQTNLLSNGNFSSGTTSWNFNANATVWSNNSYCYSCPNYAPIPVDVNTGNRIDNATGSFSQYVLIPQNATTANLTFNAYISTNEVSTTIGYDFLTVKVNGVTQIQLSNLHTNYGYQQFNLNLGNISSWSGSYINVEFEAFTDGLKPTIFRIDDIQFIVNSNQNSVQPDYQISQVTLDKSTYEPLETVSLNCIVSNIGLGAANSYSNIKFYYSNDNYFDQFSDTYLSSVSISPLNINQTHNFNSSFQIPNSAQSGPAYILAVADADQQIIEGSSGELNNVIAKSVSINTVLSYVPDILVSSINLNQNQVIPGNSVICNFVLNNQAAGQGVSNFSVGVYLSSDNVFGNNDVNVYQTNLSLYNGQQQTVNANVLIPANYPLGTHYLIVKADNFNEVSESNEVNNHSVVTIYTITNGVEFSLNDYVSHLYWPFYNEEDLTPNPISYWEGQTDGDATKNWKYTNDHDLNDDGILDHHLNASWFSQDWRYVVNGINQACGKRIYSPLKGQIITLSKNCININSYCEDPACNSTQNTAGNYIVIRSTQANNTNFVFRILHLKSVNPQLTNGMLVNVGTFLGEIGSTGNSSGPHVHAQLYKNLTPNLYSQGGYSSDIFYAADFKFDATYGGTGGDVVLSNDKELANEIINVFPNPIADILNWSYPQEVEVKSFSIVDLMGESVYSKVNMASQGLINLGHLPEGMYFAIFETDRGWITKKLLKE